MKVNVFKTQCTSGTHVVDHKGRKGIVQKISQDRVQALVLFEGGEKEWCQYYMLDFDKPKP